MNNTIPGWNFQSDSCVINQKNPTWPDQQLVELLWQNGQIVFQSQTQRKPFENSYDSRKVQKNDPSTLRTSETYGNTSNLSQQDEIVSSWIQYPVEDPLEQQLSSNLLSQFAPCEVEPFKPIKQLEEGKFAKFDAASSPPNANLSSQPNIMRPSSNHMPAPRFHHAPVSSSQKINDFGGSPHKAPKFSTLPRSYQVGASCTANGSSASADAQFREKVNANVSQNEARECSVMTVGSSHCGSNQIPQEQDFSKISSSGAWDTTFSAEHDAVRDYCVQRSVPWSGKGKSSEMVEPTLTSSSGGSGSSSLEKTCSLSTGNHGLKRKANDADELEEQSEATEPNSAAGNKASQRSGSSKRNRSAEVHNLSERRRRDRINEKMKTLQQLIPNSNKTDKASVLEEAIEYMKSLQLQLQIMWMGAGGMAPMMFPGIQNYLSQMYMGLAAPSIQHPMQLPRMPSLDQSMSVAQAQNKAIMCQNPVLAAFNYQNQMQNPCLAEQYARYMMAYHHLMQSSSQPMNVFGYGSHGVQPSQTMIAPSNGSGPMSAAANFDDSRSGKMGPSTFQLNSST